MFKLLRAALEAVNVDESTFLSRQIDDVLDHSTQTIKSKADQSLAEQLAVDLNWLRTPYHLLLRVLKLADNQQLSFREQTLLSKLVRSQRSFADIDFDDVAAHFAGKSVETLRKAVKSML